MVNKVLSKKYKTALGEVKTPVFWSKLSFVKLQQIEHLLIFFFFYARLLEKINAWKNPSVLGHFTPDFFSAVIETSVMQDSFTAVEKTHVDRRTRGLVLQKKKKKMESEAYNNPMSARKNQRAIKKKAYHPTII